MNIVPARFACAGLLALMAACGPAPPPIQLQQQVGIAGRPPITVRFTIRPDHQRVQDRYVAAALAVLQQSGEWLGPLPMTTLTVVDPPWQQAPPPATADVVLMDATPLWSTETSMTPELAAARAVSRRVWRTLIDARALPPWFPEALAEITARRAVAGLFEKENPPGFAFYEERYLGSFLPRGTRIHLRQETDGDPLPAYRVNRSSGDMRVMTAKAVLTLGTLERWVGRPAFDQLVAEFARAQPATPPTLADFARTASEVSAQDLSWLFDEAFGSSRVFDYGVESLASAADPAGGFVTTVVVGRFGDARFTGSSAPPVGGFESGRGITLLVRFDDGQRRIDQWDGRDRRKTFHYRSRARVAAAVVDPDRTLLLDVRPSNNSATLSPQAGTAAIGWAARWLGWMQHALLTYGALL